MNCPVCGGNMEQQACGAVACSSCGEHDVPADLPSVLATCTVCGWQAPQRAQAPQFVSDPASAERSADDTR